MERVQAQGRRVLAWRLLPVALPPPRLRRQCPPAPRCWQPDALASPAGELVQVPQRRAAGRGQQVRYTTAGAAAPVAAVVCHRCARAAPNVLADSCSPTVAAAAVGAADDAAAGAAAPRTGSAGSRRATR